MLFAYPNVAGDVLGTKKKYQGIVQKYLKELIPEGVSDAVAVGIEFGVALLLAVGSLEPHFFAGLCLQGDSRRLQASIQENEGRKAWQRDPYRRSR